MISKPVVLIGLNYYMVVELVNIERSSRLISCKDFVPKESSPFSTNECIKSIFFRSGFIFLVSTQCSSPSKIFTIGNKC